MPPRPEAKHQNCQEMAPDLEFASAQHKARDGHHHDHEGDQAQYVYERRMQQEA